MNIFELERKEQELIWELQDIRRKMAEEINKRDLFIPDIKISIEGEIGATKLTKEEYKRAVK